MYCTACNRPCETAPINLGPVTEADHRLLRDSYTEEEYSTCCEAQVSRFGPDDPERLVVRLTQGQGVTIRPNDQHTPNGVKLTFKNGDELVKFFDMVKEKVESL